EAAIAEGRRVARRGVLSGVDLAYSGGLKPLWDPHWNPLWDVLNETGLPLRFHTRGGYSPEYIPRLTVIGCDPHPAPAGVAEADLGRAGSGFAANITSYQMNMSSILMSFIFGGVLERYPRIRVVLGEAGIGWIPYVLHRMDAEWEDQFRDLELTMAPSDYWRRQCYATYQTDPGGIKLIDDLGADRGLLGSDFPP